MLRNTRDDYGWIAMALHWSMALVIPGMLVLGLWMRSLTYYDSWYQPAPFIHKSIGVLLFIVLVIRVMWRWGNLQPVADVSLSRMERYLSHWLHLSLYLLLFSIMLSGYLISTADGKGISVFDWFTVPALISHLENQEDIAGEIHYWLAVSTMILVALHALAALKHHFINKDRTLKKMLGRSH